MDESFPECAATLVRSVAAALDNGEVVVRPCFVLHDGWEGVVVPLPVVRSVFEVELFPCRCGSDGDEPDAIGTGDSLCPEMSSPVEPIINASAPTGAYGWVGVDVDGDESLFGERLIVVLVRPDIADVILWVIRPLFGAAGATVVEDRDAGRNGAEGEDTPARVGDVRDPQPESETAAPMECVSIDVGGRWGRGVGLACTGKIPAVGGGRVRGRGWRASERGCWARGLHRCGRLCRWWPLLWAVGAWGGARLPGLCVRAGFCDVLPCSLSSTARMPGRGEAYSLGVRLFPFAPMVLRGLWGAPASREPVPGGWGGRGGRGGLGNGWGGRVRVFVSSPRGE